MSEIYIFTKEELVAYTRAIYERDNVPAIEPMKLPSEDDVVAARQNKNYSAGYKDAAFEDGVEWALNWLKIKLAWN